MNETTETADTQLAPGIVRNPDRRGGRPTIAGTRITVEDVIARLAGGWTIEDILHAFPHLTREQVLQAISYAVVVVHHGPWPQLDGEAHDADCVSDDGPWASEPLK
jgi:uncharacterized protein (DUF433 family)